jgi:Type II secretory pathway, component PulD
LVGWWSTRTIESIEGVPGLMNVPILGWLFKRKTTSEDKVSLFIFLTPYVIENPEDLSKITEEHQRLAQELRRRVEEANKKKRKKDEAED